jgi:hypothetical protein
LYDQHIHSLILCPGGRAAGELHVDGNNLVDDQKTNRLENSHRAERAPTDGVCTSAASASFQQIKNNKSQERGRSQGDSLEAALPVMVMRRVEEADAPRMSPYTVQNFRHSSADAW